MVGIVVNISAVIIYSPEEKIFREPCLLRYFLISWWLVSPASFSFIRDQGAAVRCCTRSYAGRFEQQGVSPVLLRKCRASTVSVKQTAPNLSCCTGLRSCDLIPLHSRPCDSPVPLLLRFGGIIVDAANGAGGRLRQDTIARLRKQCLGVRTNSDPAMRRSAMRPGARVPMTPMAMTVAVAVSVSVSMSMPPR